jgi:hypothetical protein
MLLRFTPCLCFKRMHVCDPKTCPAGRCALFYWLTLFNSVQTLKSLSIPHVTAFANGLFGAGADIKQQIASQYFTMFILPNSSTIHNDFWYNALGLVIDLCV